ncbi:YybH family protein [Tsukamurella sp. USMM236]|uniref:YybH family protein n=1 Tax=Tsukamurella sp. USMM236 TaxID=3081301 RepID=UPI003017BC90
MVSRTVRDEIVDHCRTHRLVSHGNGCQRVLMDHTAHAIELTTEPHLHPDVFAAAFNSGDPAALERVYEPSAVFIPREDTAVTGDERRSANTALQSLGVPIRIAVKQVHVFDDALALLIVDWQIVGRTAAGDDVDVRGTATDVARRGRDGRWRYVIDNPFGVAERT